MKKISIYLVFLIFFSTAFSQVYQPDKITINSKEYDYRFHHLEQYFNHYPDKRIVQNKDSTIINRGYIAFYEIYEDVLYLTDIKIQTDSLKLRSVRDEFSASKEPRIPLRWVNGVVQVGVGIDDFKRDSLQPINDDNLIFEIQRGKVTRKFNFRKEEMRIFKKFQWNKFLTTNEYFVLHRKLETLGLSEIEINNHIFNNVLYYSKRIFLQK